ncbi:hypothetical protein [Abyssisolibacter fermentans]|uniref:hypothetical protein n=1 Tax=Abyssisolibacter fermentans TaxID=1766203 RepID=UPI0008316F88|nr:hypothetical protein [Abyssisolibacter fermentans]
MQCKYFSNIMIPFSYENTYAKLLETIEFKKNDKGVCCWRKEEIKTERFYEHIDNLIASSGYESLESDNYCKNVGQKFVLDQNNGRNFFHQRRYKSIDVGVKEANTPIVPAQNKDQLTFNDEKNGDFNFSIESIEMYIIETNIGFINYKMRYFNKENNQKKDDKIEVDQLIDYIYRLKKLYSFNDGNIELHKRIGKDQYIKFRFCMASLTQSIISDTGIKVKTFFESQQQKPRQALIYTGVLLEEEIKQKKSLEYMFYLRHGFRHNYNISHTEYSIQNNEEVFSPFENILWGVSMEGCGALAFPMENNNDDFITQGFLERAQHSYFYMYLLALSQRHSLINFSIEASTLPSKLKIEDDPQQKIKVINNLKERIAFFNLKWMFKHLSNISHYVKFYELLRRNLRIEEVLTELDFELSILSQMIRFAEEEVKEKELKDRELEKEKEEERQKTFNKLILIITSLFAIIQTTGSLWPLIDGYKRIISSGNKSIIFIIIEVIFVLVFLILIVQAVSKRKK